MSAMRSPFGAEATRLLSLPTPHVAELYRQKCGVDVTAHFKGEPQITLYECSQTGYRFWTPPSVAGDEAFYRLLSGALREYYRETRWEYAQVFPHLKRSDRTLEVGCGRGYFLRAIEERVADACGLEFNREAIANKATRFEVLPETVEAHARARPSAYDVVCSYQVLEHVIDPAAFIAGCLACLKPGGLLALSTPNIEYVPFADRSDPLDLPPHHMGHFSPSVYRALAALHNAAVSDIVLEHRNFASERVSERTRSSLAYKTLAPLLTTLMNRAYRVAAEPGPNVLALFRKR